ncbi:hypothetical protein SRIMM317S_00183 [Streptomyces rimosus subsp. rimosus]
MRTLFEAGASDLDEGAPARSLAHLAEQAAWCTPDSCGAAATVSTGEDTAEAPTAVTHPDLSALVSVQWESGEGPIPTALDSGRATGADDLLHERRWPEYRAEALQAGVRSSATLPYRRDGITLTITVYGFRPGLKVEKGCTATDVLGELAATGLARERRYRDALAEVDQLDTALRTRPVVDQACGILMYVLGCVPDRLRHAAPPVAAHQPQTVRPRRRPGPYPRTRTGVGAAVPGRPATGPRPRRGAQRSGARPYARTGPWPRPVSPRPHGSPPQPPAHRLSADR